MRVAIVSHVLPPTWSGQSMVLERLLRGFDPDDYVLIRTMDLPVEEDHYAERLPARSFHLPETFLSLPGPAWRPRVATARSLMQTLRVRARGIAEILREQDCDAVVACTGGDMQDVPAAYLAARRAGARFFPYYFDHWSQQSQTSARRRRFAERVEPRIVRGADAVIVPNEFLARELETKYGARTAIVRNGCEVPDQEPPPEPVTRDRAAIVYTGAVYAANHDTFRNLIAALGLTGGGARIHVYTAQGAQELAAAGIEGPVELHAHLPASEMPRVHRSADVLFLPLAFESPYPSLIRTSNPGKMGEYLASGRPILVHAPPDSFVAGYFREHGCGVVVDELDPRKLAAALERLLGDERLRDEVGRAARARAVADFDIRRARAAFGALVGLRPSGVELEDERVPAGRGSA